MAMLFLDGSLGGPAGLVSWTADTERRRLSSQRTAYKIEGLLWALTMPCSPL